MNRNLSLGLLLLAALGWYASRDEKPPAQPEPVAPATTTVSLPRQPVIGVSGSRILHSNARQQGTTAAGQIFTPPAEAPTLIRLGFQFHQLNHNGFQPEVSLQIMLAEWQVDRPAARATWASVPRTLPSISEPSRYSWQDFEVPAIELDASKEYIAWVTLSELGNPPGTRIGIPEMGPRFKTSPVTDPQAVPIHTYAEGRAAYFREANPEGTREKMTSLAWQEQKAGDNLYFRMLFERSPQ